MRFIDLQITQHFRTGAIEIPGGLAWREFIKRSDSTASDAADDARIVKFHRLCPVYLLEEPCAN